MDPHARATTWEIIEDLRRGGVTVMLTTHGMDEAERLCDRVAIIDSGRLLALGSPAELTRQAPVDETRFSAAAGLDLSALAAALSLPCSAVQEPSRGEYTIAAPATPELVAALAGWLRDRNVTLGDLKGGRRSLEEVFLALTKEPSVATPTPAGAPGARRRGRARR
jgi:ABC-2 type transport system ATP-binding protein